jgi:hypothetical protein
MIARFLLTVLFALVPGAILAPVAVAQGSDTIYDQAIRLAFSATPRSSGYRRPSTRHKRRLGSRSTPSWYRTRASKHSKPGVSCSRGRPRRRTSRRTQGSSWSPPKTAGPW